MEFKVGYYSMDLNAIKTLVDPQIVWYLNIT